MARATKPTTKNTKRSVFGEKKVVGLKTKTGKATFLKSLPESVEHIEIVQQVAGVLEELQKRVLDVKEEASKELKKLMNRYETNYRGLEKKVHTVTLEAKRQAQTSMIQLLQKWHEHKEKLPKPLAKELEKIIDQIGTRMVAQSSKKKKTTSRAATTKITKKSELKSTRPKSKTMKAKTVTDLDQN